MDELQMDRPTAAELLEIIAETLSETVVPATASHAQHHARVAANLCRILGRELAASSTTPTESAAYDDVLELVRSKLAVVKPGYDTHGADQERDIVA